MFIYIRPKKLLRRSVIVFFLIWMLLGNICFSQELLNNKNLVPNGSFENFKKKSGSIKSAIPWTQIASVDYYQKPLDNDTTKERGALDGDCYIGLRFQKHYKEFAVVKLVEPLKYKHLYYFEMHIRLAYWSNAILKSFGVLFNKTGYKNQKDVDKAFMIDTINIKNGLNNYYRWIKISGYYKAYGGEKYLTIGNFSADIKKDLMRLNFLKYGFRVFGFLEAYYFVDNVKLIPVKEPEEQLEIEIVGSVYVAKNNQQDSIKSIKENLQAGDKIVLKNIYFDEGKSYLLPESYQELNKVAKYLMQHPNWIVQINGHSDNTGSKRKNMKLSEERAKAVFMYLIEKGVQNKMYFKGFGDTMPIGNNNTIEGRIKNRRVEIEILKN
ncbi:MAG: OmpA family protein [Bacteroidia bacterium]|nr:OmpA family protein [Bacteroidia bacterium]